MSTHDDYDIDDQSGSSMLTDLNDLLDALRSNSSDTVVPTSFIDYQFWVDTTTNILKMDGGASTISICNIDTGLFFGVGSTTDADALDTLTTSTNVDSTNIIIRRDAAGAVTGDMINGGDVTGDAGALGASNQDSTFLLNSSNFTGALPNTETVGGNSAGSINLSGGLTSGVANDGADWIYFRPFRRGTFRFSYFSTEDEGTIKIGATDGPTQATATSGTDYVIANTGGVADWTAVMTGASSVAYGDVYTCGTTSSDLDTDLSATGALVVPMTTWAMVAGTTYTADLTINNGGWGIIDLTGVTGVTSDTIMVNCADLGWDTDIVLGNTIYDSFTLQQYLFQN